MVTIYFGADSNEAEAKAIGDNLRSPVPAAPVEVIDGGQLNYNYIGRRIKRRST